ncbi:MAG: ABC transporter ATP-binding protein [Bacillota bacterium]
MTALIELKNIRVVKDNNTILEVAHLEVNRGETLTVIGPNGAGKSTLLQVTALLMSPTLGNIFWDGKMIEPRQVTALRRRMATVFQEPLLLSTTVEGNIMAGLRYRGIPGHQRRKQIEHWLDRLQIRHLARQPARTLSGGEAQRVNLARALVLEPEILFLDEPFNALDILVRNSLMGELQEILTNSAITAVFVTHDFYQLPILAQRVLAMTGGRIVQSGTPEELLFRPATGEIAQLVGMENIIGGTVLRNKDPLTWVELIGSQEVLARSNCGGGKVTVCWRAEDCQLLPVSDIFPLDGSNRWEGTIKSMGFHGAHYYRVEVNCRFPVVALVERQYFSSKGWSVGDPVVVSLSPDAVHVIPGKNLPRTSAII